MNPRRLRSLLASFRNGDVNLNAVLTALRGLPFENLGDARIDHHRRLRRGLPEIVYGAGKSPDQVVRICRRMLAAGGPVIVTRLSGPAMEALSRSFPEIRLHESARMAVMGTPEPRRNSRIAVCCAGTTDIPVAEEAAITLETLGNRVNRLYDVGVAGLQRLLHHRRELDAASVIIAVAGMEGALPSVIAGLVGCPVIGVPTSVGYGAAFGGLAALLGMLNSCSGGLLVVNIDNGLGAALAAHLIVRRPARRSARTSADSESANSKRPTRSRRARRSP